MVLISTIDEEYKLYARHDKPADILDTDRKQQHEAVISQVPDANTATV